MKSPPRLLEGTHTSRRRGGAGHPPLRAVATAASLATQQTSNELLREAEYSLFFRTSSTFVAPSSSTLPAAGCFFCAVAPGFASIFSAFAGVFAFRKSSSASSLRLFLRINSWSPRDRRKRTCEWRIQANSKGFLVHQAKGLSIGRVEHVRHPFRVLRSPALEASGHLLPARFSPFTALPWDRQPDHKHEQHIKRCGEVEPPTISTVFSVWSSNRSYFWRPTPTSLQSQFRREFRRRSRLYLDQAEQFPKLQPMGCGA